VLGPVVLTSCAGWTLAAAVGHEAARPEGVLLALLAVAAGFAAGRVAGALLPTVAPAAAAGMPAGPMAPGGAGAAAGGGGGGAGPGARAGASAPVGQKPSGTTASTRPTAAGKASARTASAGVSGPAAQRKPNERKDTTDAAAVAPIPVSAARAERDAIAEASTAEAARRKNGGTDPLRLARRIAAALPLIGTVPLLLYTLAALAMGSNLWPLMAIFLTPFALFYLVAVLALRWFGRSAAPS